MVIKKYEVRTFKEVYECTDCRIGESNFDSTVISEGKVFYEHRCSHCGSMVVLDKKFPNLIYIPMKNI
jgi:predicted RNA-binding Zn-ribbon protein involved in translation (DUF1610 family)